MAGDEDTVAVESDSGSTRTASRQTLANPFNPNLGSSPPRFAGRDRLVGEVIRRVEHGAGGADFHTVIVGPRGVGKTVFLAEVLRRGARRNRWIPIHWNASRPLHQTLSEQQRTVSATLGMLRGESRLLAASVDSNATRIRVGVEAELTVRPTRDSTYRMLEMYARTAAAHHAVLVVAADELQAAPAYELQEFVVALQQLANVQRLPLALVAVGLPSTGRLLGGLNFSPGGAEHLTPITIDKLDLPATRDAIETPFIDAGRIVEEAAIEQMVTATHGYPYAIQLVGHACWHAAGREPTVALPHADAACKTLHHSLDTPIFQPWWAAMSPGDRRYLYVAARLCDANGIVSSLAIAGKLGRTAKHVARTRHRLVNQHYVFQPVGRGAMQFFVPGFAGWVVDHVDQQSTRQTPALNAASGNVFALHKFT